MGLSRHYTSDRIVRETAIKKIGLGDIAYRTRIYDDKRNRYFIYEISTTAILTVRASDDENLIITRYPARPSRIKKYWNNAPDEIIKLSVEHTQMGLVF